MPAGDGCPQCPWKAIWASSRSWDFGRSQDRKHRVPDPTETRTAMTNPDLSQLDGAAVTNQDDEELGKVTGLLVDNQLGVPTWVVVESGLFGTHHTLVPLAESRVIGGELLVPYTKDDLRSAPHHDPDVALTVKDEQLLFDHYNVGYGTADTTGPHTGVEVSSTGLD